MSEKREEFFRIVNNYLVENSDRKIHVYYGHGRNKGTSYEESNPNKLPIVIDPKRNFTPYLYNNRARYDFPSGWRYFRELRGEKPSGESAWEVLRFKISELEPIPEFSFVKEVYKNEKYMQVQYFIDTYFYEKGKAYKGALKNADLNVPINNLKEKQRTNLDRDIDYLENYKRNKEVGNSGEMFVIQEEKNKLVKAGKESLAKRILKQPDSFGYDILSFDEEGNEKYIEVKTTTRELNEPFYLTTNENEFCNTHKERYFLYRVFNFNMENKKGEYEIFRIGLDDIIEKTPIAFRCTFNEL